MCGNAYNMKDVSTSMGISSPRSPINVALVGVHGYGLHHLRALRPLIEAGRAALVGVVDPQTPQGESRELIAAAPHHESLADLLAARTPDVVILATPIHTHADLARAALEAGSHVLLEKPPTASLAEFSALRDATRRSGRSCQVGFQSLGSQALQVIDDAIDAGEIGEVTGIGAVGTWLRSTDYYARAPWAGRRTMDGRAVVDGVVTNPLAHAVATALRIDRSSRAEDVAAVEVDLYHAHDIQADDTSAVRIVTRRGTRVALGLTLCAATQTAPRIVVHGTAGSITLFYTQDVVEITGVTGTRRVEAGRTSLLENLLEHAADPAVPLLSSLEDTGAFMRVLEAVRTSPDPTPVPEEYIDWRTDDSGHHPVVQDVEQWCERVATELRTFTTLGAPWARQHGELAQLEVAGTQVARYVDGAGTSALDSPRPHLHPVRTLGGVVVTDTAPADHTWHAGVGVAVQDVAGHNLWGGRTYLPGQGYTWRSDHGRITHEEWLAQGADELVQRLAWRGHDDSELLRETRTTAWQAAEHGWQLDLTFTLHNDGTEPLELGSPGSNGRPAGGYGGFFWRLPACTDVDVRTATDRGEEQVHGTLAPWLAWSADTAGGPFTLALAPGDAATAGDPWFVRAAGYPGIGSSLAWDAPVTIAPGQQVTRRVRALVADGRLTDAEVAAALE